MVCMTFCFPIRSSLLPQISCLCNQRMGFFPRPPRPYVPVPSHVSLHACVGVVALPSQGVLYGDAVWSCRLLLTQVGYSADSASNGGMLCQEAYTLLCYGAKEVDYCLCHLREGSLVHVVSQLSQHPKYVPTNDSYEDTTELLVSDSFGSITKLASL